MIPNRDRAILWREILEKFKKSNLDLIFTKIISVTVNGVTQNHPKWNPLLIDFIRRGLLAVGSLDELKKICSANMVQGKKIDQTYNYYKDINISVQGETANYSCKHIIEISTQLGLHVIFKVNNDIQITVSESGKLFIESVTDVAPLDEDEVEDELDEEEIEKILSATTVPGGKSDLTYKYFKNLNITVQGESTDSACKRIIEMSIQQGLQVILNISNGVQITVNESGKLSLEFVSTVGSLDELIKNSSSNMALMEKTNQTHRSDNDLNISVKDESAGFACKQIIEMSIELGLLVVLNISNGVQITVNEAGELSLGFVSNE